MFLLSPCFLSAPLSLLVHTKERRTDCEIKKKAKQTIEEQKASTSKGSNLKNMSLMFLYRCRLIVSHFNRSAHLPLVKENKNIEMRAGIGHWIYKILLLYRLNDVEYIEINCIRQFIIKYTIKLWRQFPHTRKLKI